MTRDTVTLRDVYDRIDRLSDKIDARVLRVEDRVDSLEDFKSRSLGIFTIVSLFASGLFAWVWNKLTGKA